MVLLHCGQAAQWIHLHFWWFGVRSACHAAIDIDINMSDEKVHGQLSAVVLLGSALTSAQVWFFWSCLLQNDSHPGAMGAEGVHVGGIST